MRAYKLTRKRSSYERCSLRIGVLRNFAKSQENTCARVSFLIKLHAEVYGIKFKTLNRLRSIDYYFKNYPLFVITCTGATFFLHLLCEHLFFTCVVWKHFKKRKWILTFIHRTCNTCNQDILYNRHKQWMFSRHKQWMCHSNLKNQNERKAKEINGRKLKQINLLPCGKRIRINQTSNQ